VRIQIDARGGSSEGRQRAETRARNSARLLFYSLLTFLPFDNSSLTALSPSPLPLSLSLSLSLAKRVPLLPLLFYARRFSLACIAANVAFVAISYIFIIHSNRDSACIMHSMSQPYAILRLYIARQIGRQREAPRE